MYNLSELTQDKTENPNFLKSVKGIIVVNKNFNQANFRLDDFIDIFY